MSEEHPYWSILDMPLSEEKPEGEDVSSEREYEELSDEMMKLGGLSQSSMDWEKIERISRRILQQKSRDIVVFRYFIQALSRQNNISDIACALHLCAVFLEKWSPVAYPKIDTKKGQRLHQINTSQAIKGLSQQAIRLSEEFPQSPKWHMVLKEIDLLWEATDKASTEVDIHDLGQLKKVVRDLCEHLSEETDEVEEQPQADTTQDTESSSETATERLVQAPPSIRFDDERSIKRSLISVADFISQVDPLNISNFSLRRFATWFDVTSLPPAKGNNKTEVPPPPVDMVLKYTENLEAPTIELWQQLEASLGNLPFWFFGQYISYQYAIKLEYPQIAQIIKDETIQFFNRLEGLKDLCYHDNSPLVDDKVLTWIKESTPASQEIKDIPEEKIPLEHPREIETVGLQWQSAWDKSFKLAKDGRIKQALSLVDKVGKEIKQPRDIFYMRMAIADIHTECGLYNLAISEYEKLLALAEKQNLSQWEPSTIKRLKIRIDYLLHSNE